MSFGLTKSSISLPDSKKGERIILFTTAKEASKNSLRNFLIQNKQSMLLLPASLEIVEKLPLLGSGKTDYVEIMNMAIKRGQNNNVDT